MRSSFMQAYLEEVRYIAIRNNKQNIGQQVPFHETELRKITRLANTYPGYFLIYL